MFFQLSKKKGSQVIKKPEKVKGSLFIWALPLCLILNWVLSVCEDIQDGDNNWNWKWLTALRCHQKDCASLPQKRFLCLQIRHLDDDEIFCLNCSWNISGGLNGTGHFYKFMQMNFLNIEIMFGSRDTQSYMSLSNAVTRCNSWNGCSAMVARQCTLTQVSAKSHPISRSLLLTTSCLSGTRQVVEPCTWVRSLHSVTGRRSFWGCWLSLPATPFLTSCSARTSSLSLIYQSVQELLWMWAIYFSRSSMLLICSTFNQAIDIFCAKHNLCTTQCVV